MSRKQEDRDERNHSRERTRVKMESRNEDQHRERSRSFDRNRYPKERPTSRGYMHRDRTDRYSNDKRNRKSRDEKQYTWGREEDKGKPKVKVEKEEPNFETTGKLAEETNTYRGVVIKYSEPPEARIPKRRWRFYPFKNDLSLPVLYLHRQSGYLIGRDRKIVDFAVDHPSCSKQHAAFQYRLVPVKLDNGRTVQQIKPYIIDLDSANGTFLNDTKIEPRKYYELREKDCIKFGFSSREYVLLHENSVDAKEDDDVQNEPEATTNIKSEIKEEKSSD